MYRSISASVGCVMLFFKAMQSYYIKCNPRFSAAQAGLHHSQGLLGFLVHDCRLLSWSTVKQFHIEQDLSELQIPLPCWPLAWPPLHQATGYRNVKTRSKQCQNRIIHSTKWVLVQSVRAHYRPGRVAKLVSVLLKVILVPDSEDEAQSWLWGSICFISSHRILHVFLLCDYEFISSACGWYHN